MQSHGNILVEILESGMVELEAREKHLNAVKMITYLICQFIDIYESELTKPSATVNSKVFKLCVYFCR